MECAYSYHSIYTTVLLMCDITTHCVDIREQLKLIEKGVLQRESRFINRALRKLLSIRKRLNDTVLRRLLMVTFPSGKCMHLFISVCLKVVFAWPLGSGLWRV